jgi:D-aspartate ligase
MASPQPVRPAVVMNMFYTGLGIARSLAQRNITVIGLSAHRGAYGNFSRSATIRRAPDSREAPDELLAFLLEFRRETPNGAVLFPTRDDDVLFLDRFREQLEPHYRLVIPGRRALEICLDKWETDRAAQTGGIPAPRTWLIGSREDLLAALPAVVFPCVLKPVFAQHWRKSGNWDLVGRRKAVAAGAPQELLAEYDRIAHAEPRALIQERIPGGDANLWIAACYFDKNSQFVSGFTAQKLLQVPTGLGTGCIVQTVDRPEVLEQAVRLLEQIRFTGIAEVEFKGDGAGSLKLIEINPRPWDQHRLGNICGVDVVYAAYCDLAGLPLPRFGKATSGQKWIAEDVFCLALLQSLWRRDGNFRNLLRLARGRRAYAVSSFRDPLPLLGFAVTQFIPEFFRGVTKLLWQWSRACFNTPAPIEGVSLEHALEHEKRK